MRLLIAVLFFLVPNICLAEDWTPPENPNPTKILREAKKDAAHSNYKVALAKQLWYHENAVRIEPAQSAVRRSFALASWLELGEKYPPALKAMREIRDLTEEKIRDENRVRVRFDDFLDFVSLNSTLRQNERTVVLFKWLHEDDAEDAKRVYPIAKPALVRGEEFETCGKFVNPEEDLKQIAASYKFGATMAVQFGEGHQDFVNKTFINNSAILVGILVKNERNEEAQATADALKKLITDDALATKLERELESALKGILPTPWP